jgi:hypothetical protein
MSACKVSNPFLVIADHQRIDAIQDGTKVRVHSANVHI